MVFAEHCAREVGLILWHTEVNGQLPISGIVNPDAPFAHNDESLVEVAVQAVKGWLHRSFLQSLSRFVNFRALNHK